MLVVFMQVNLMFGESSLYQCCQEMVTVVNPLSEIDFFNNREISQEMVTVVNPLSEIDFFNNREIS